MRPSDFMSRLASEAEDGDKAFVALRLLQHALSLVFPLLFLPLEAMPLAVLHSVGQVGVDLASGNDPQRRQLGGGWLLACSLVLLAQAHLSPFTVSSLTATAGVVTLIMYGHVSPLILEVRMLVGCVAAAAAIEQSSLQPSDAALCGLLADLACSCLGSFVHHRNRTPASGTDSTEADDAHECEPQPPAAEEPSAAIAEPGSPPAATAAAAIMGDGPVEVGSAGKAWAWPVPEGEERRVRLLRAMRVLDSERDPVYAHLVHLGLRPPQTSTRPHPATPPHPSPPWTAMPHSPNHRPPSTPSHALSPHPAPCQPLWPLTCRTAPSPSSTPTDNGAAPSTASTLCRWKDGMCMACARHVHGMRMACAWNVYGMCMVFQLLADAARPGLLRIHHRQGGAGPRPTSPPPTLSRRPTIFNPTSPTPPTPTTRPPIPPIPPPTRPPTLKPRARTFAPAPRPPP